MQPFRERVAGPASPRVRGSACSPHRMTLQLKTATLKNKTMLLQERKQTLISSLVTQPPPCRLEDTGQGVQRASMNGATSMDSHTSNENPRFRANVPSELQRVKKSEF